MHQLPVDLCRKHVCSLQIQTNRIISKCSRAAERLFAAVVFLPPGPQSTTVCPPSACLSLCMPACNLMMYKCIWEVFSVKKQTRNQVYPQWHEGKLPLVFVMLNFLESVLKWDWFENGPHTHTHTHTTGRRGCMNDIVSIMVLLCMSSSPIPPLCNHCNIPGATQTTNVRKGWMNEPIMYKMIRNNCESFALYSPFFELINTDCDIERRCLCVSFCGADKWGVGHLCAVYLKWSYL